MSGVHCAGNSAHLCLTVDAGCHHSGPTRYHYYYNGQYHYYGTRTWDRCDGHCEQAVVVSKVKFTLFYGSGVATAGAAAKLGVQELWPSIKPHMIAVSVPNGNSVDFEVVMPDGASATSFADTVKSCVDAACRSLGTCALAAPSTHTSIYSSLQCPQTVRVSVQQFQAEVQLVDENQEVMALYYIIIMVGSCGVFVCVRSAHSLRSKCRGY
eukprot:COSAG02_NODE_706_length_18259_cov_10.340253_15_plen_211_part_00